MAKNKFLNVIVLVLLGTILFSCNKRKKIPPDFWHEQYRSTEDYPYDYKLVTDQLKDLFPKSKVYTDVNVGGNSKKSFQELYKYDDYTLEDNYEYIDSLEDEDPLSIIYVGRGFSPSDKNYSALMHAVAAGNEVFVGAKFFKEGLQSTLNFKVISDGSVKGSELKFKDGTESIPYPNNTLTSYFELNEEGEYKVLATNEMNLPVLVEFKFHYGKFILCCVPKIYTNYFLLKKGKEKAIEKAFLSLHDRDVYITSDTRYYSKSGSQNEKRNSREGSLSWLKKQPSLFAAFVYFFVFVVIFLLFKMKRMQRPIPIINQLENSTLKYVNIIGGMYMKNKEYKNLSHKKIKYFLEHIRSKYHLKTTDFNEVFRSSLRERSGASMELVNKVFDEIEAVKKNKNTSQQDLVNLNNLLQRFKRQSKL